MVYWPTMLREFHGQALVKRSVAFAVRTDRTDTDDLMEAIRRAVWAVNPRVPLADVQSLGDIYSRSMARVSFALVMLAIAGAMALLLGIVGVYGVMSYAVSQRTREIGIRLALGAQQAVLKGMFVRDGLTLATVGVAGGVVAALALMPVMSSLLFDVTPLGSGDVRGSHADISRGCRVRQLCTSPSRRPRRSDGRGLMRWATRVLISPWNVPHSFFNSTQAFATSATAAWTSGLFCAASVRAGVPRLIEMTRSLWTDQDRAQAGDAENLLDVLHGVNVLDHDDRQEFPRGSEATRPPSSRSSA